MNLHRLVQLEFSFRKTCQGILEKKRTFLRIQGSPFTPHLLVPLRMSFSVFASHCTTLSAWCSIFKPLVRAGACFSIRKPFDKQGR
jgi:hypothetical protein